MDITQMPDDVLLDIFMYLNAFEVFFLRQVCKRWHYLVLHNYNWNRRIVQDRDGLPLINAALRFAPCLEELSLIRSPIVSNNLEHLLTTTNCAVSKLKLYVTDIGKDLLTIQNQCKLGNLLKLTLRFTYTVKYSEKDLKNLFSFLKSCKISILEIKCNIYESILNNLLCEEMVHESESERKLLTSQRDLKHLSFYQCNEFSSPSLLSYVMDVINVKCNILEKLAFVFCHCSAPVTLTIPFIPRLKEITCPFTANLFNLLQCPNLNTVNLFLNDTDKEGTFVSAACQFLHKAFMLQHVKFSFDVKVKSSADVLSILSSLTQCGSRELKSLHINDVRPYTEKLKMLWKLSDISPSISSLRKLELSGHSIKLFKTINSVSVPHLNYIIFSIERQCPHAFSHLDYISALFQDKPNLHIVIFRKSINIFRCTPCNFCKMHCHLELRNGTKYNYIGFYKHCKSKSCNMHHRKYFWVQL